MAKSKVELVNIDPIEEKFPDFETNFNPEDGGDNETGEDFEGDLLENEPVVSEQELIKVLMKITYCDFGKVFRTGEFYELTKEQYAVMGDYCVCSK